MISSCNQLQNEQMTAICCIFDSTEKNSSQFGKKENRFGTKKIERDFCCPELRPFHLANGKNLYQVPKNLQLLLIFFCKTGFVPIAM